MKRKSLDEMDNMLKQALINSKNKKYHGTMEEMNLLPSTDIQIKQFNYKLPKLSDVYEVK